MGSDDYVVKNLYQPGYSSFKPGENDAPMHARGFQVPASQMGITVNPGVANQLSELNKALNQGVVPVELGTISWDLWESIPEEHFHEMRRKAALAEAKLSIHAPIQGMDPSGFGEKGWDAQQQQLVENQLKDVVNKALIIDKSGNMPITVHGSNSHGSTWKMITNKDGKREEVYDTLMAVDKKTGQAIPMQQDIQYNMTTKGISEGVMDPKSGLRSHNNTTWRKEVDTVMERTNSLNDYFDKGKHINAQEVYNQVASKKRDYNELMPTEKRAVHEMQTAQSKMQDADLGVNTLFNKAVEYTQGESINKDGVDENKEKRELLNQLSQNYVVATGGYSKGELVGMSEKGRQEAYQKQSDVHGRMVAMQELGEGLREVQPEMFVTVEKFATEKASDTFANVAKYSYDKAKGDGAPIISIENMDQGRFGFSRAEDLALLSKTSREKLAGKLMDEGKSFSEAKKISEKLIGVTFDVGHLNLSRKRGYEEEDLVKEAETIREHVKHIHLTDNFGFADSHLPIGMGNVPVKKLMDALGDEGKEARKINEVGGWFQLSQESPFPHLLQASGSTVYGAGGGPTWDQSLGFQQSYSQGGGMMLPSTHYSMFGAGFGQLPTELGGSVQGPGGAGRMGGGGF